MEEKDHLINEMLERRTVMLSGEITVESMANLVVQLIKLQLTSYGRINLLINSGGGSVYDALWLCDMMTSLIKAPIRGIVIGRCGSAATFVLLHCNERIATTHSRLLIHSGTIGKISLQINEGSSGNLEDLLKEARATEEIVLRLYMSRLTPEAWSKEDPGEEKRRETVKKLIKRGDQDFNQYIHPQEAVEIGLIERVVENELDIF